MLLTKSLLQMPRRSRRLVIAASDFAILAITPWLAFSIRYGDFFVPPSWQYFLILMLPIPFIGVAVLERFGVYRMVTRYFGEDGFRRIVLATTLVLLIWALIIAVARVPGEFPRSSFLLFWLLSNALLIGNRQVVAAFINRHLRDEDEEISHDRRNTIIYGAGVAGNQLARELKFSRENNVVAFMDDDRTLWGQKVGNIKVRSPEKIDDLIANLDVREVLLALPSASFKRRHEILKLFETLPVNVKTVPSVSDITSGRMNISDISPVSFDDLLGRDSLPPDRELLKQTVEGKSVLLTGAGGSIGSELARQILRLRPRTLVLFDLSESALYQIELEIRETRKLLLRGRPTTVEPPTPTRIVAILGSILDDRAVRSVLQTHEINTVYHAAAYKHVPIVELNPVAGLNNNVFGTSIMVEAARDLAVERFVLVSTDKAVRPTSVMGASKRLAELILQANAALNDGGTIFSMVRFGNVLASSGSVVQRFNQQITEGGPVTVTHPDMTRYFMSIPEAAQLVIAAGSLATGGEVFVLDMETPVKIDDLARMMIRLSGMTVHDGLTGDIAIEYTGLRPGEKLFEELLISGETEATEHRKIMKSNERFMPLETLHRALATLARHMDNSNIVAIHATLGELVEGYHRDQPQPKTNVSSISQRFN